MRIAGVLAAVVLLAAGCTPPPAPAGVAAVLRGELTCATRCTHWFEFWADGEPARTTALRVTTTSGPVTATVTGLLPDTFYRSRLCTYGDAALPGVCAGQPGGPVTAPGQRPDPGDFDATRNLRTAGDGTAATADLGRPLSDSDTADHPISRDAGLSAAWSAGQSLWLFGDTAQRGGIEFLPGTTAAIGPYDKGVVPITLREVPTPPAPHAAGPIGPQPFLPGPLGLRATAQQSCEGPSPYPASWPSGISRIPGTDQLLISYAQTCVKSPTDMTTQHLTLATYDPVGNRLTSSSTPFSARPPEAGLPLAQRLGSPVFGGDGHLYLYAHDAAKIVVARVAADPAAWADPANFRWWDGTSWTPDPSRATPLVTVPFVAAAHVADHTGLGGHRLAMIVQTEFGTGRFQIFEADSPAGPWRPGPAGRVPDPCSPKGYGCYALAAHPELSTADQFVFTWYSPNDVFAFGHIRAGTLAW